MGIVLSASIILDGHKEQKDEDKVYKPPFYIALQTRHNFYVLPNGLSWGILICFCIFNFPSVLWLFLSDGAFSSVSKFLRAFVAVSNCFGAFLSASIHFPHFHLFPFFTPSLWHLKKWIISVFTMYSPSCRLPLYVINHSCQHCHQIYISHLPLFCICICICICFCFCRFFEITETFVFRFRSTPTFTTLANANYRILNSYR